MASPKFTRLLPTFRVTEPGSTSQPQPPPDSKSPLCSICCEDFQSPQRYCQLPCEHNFHEYCIVNWLVRESSCPNCRILLPTLPKEERSEAEVVLGDGGAVEDDDALKPVKVTVDMEKLNKLEFFKIVTVSIIGRPDVSLLLSVLESVRFALLKRCVKMVVPTSLYTDPPQQTLSPNEGSSTSLESLIKNLPKFRVSSEFLGTLLNDVCAFCKKGFQLGETTVRFPCDHVFHETCVLRSAYRNNAPPTCLLCPPPNSPDLKEFQFDAIFVGRIAMFEDITKNVHGMMLKKGYVLNIHG